MCEQKQKVDGEIIYQERATNRHGGEVRVTVARVAMDWPFGAVYLMHVLSSIYEEAEIENSTRLLTVNSPAQAIRAGIGRFDRMREEWARAQPEMEPDEIPF